MGRSRHRAAVPSQVLASVAALAIAGALALVLVVAASGALLRVGLALVVLLSIACAAAALHSARRAMSVATAQVSRERAGRSREVDALQRRLVTVEATAQRLSTSLDVERSRIASLSAELTELRRPREQVRPTLLLPLLAEAVRRAAPVPLARVQVSIDDRTALAKALAPRDAAVPAATVLADPVEDDLIDEPIELVDEQVVVLPDAPSQVAVVGEFSLIGLAAFPRPAGMPDPGLPLVAPAAEPAGDESVIDLRDPDRDRSARGA